MLKERSNNVKGFGQTGTGETRNLGIKCVVKNNLRPGFGHGLEFWFCRGGKMDILVAIVEGYRWFHNPRQKWTKVKILPKDSSALKKSTKSPDGIIQAVRNGAKKFFDTRPKDTKISEEVRVWWNG